MPKLKRRCTFLYTLGLIVLTIILVFFCYRSIFYKIGSLLLVEMKPQKVDVIIVLRGDISYSRTLEAARLFKEGYAEEIIISTSLLDDYYKMLRKHGVDIPTKQQIIFNILIQLGVPKEKIILDSRIPGGGTRGELLRIIAAMEDRRYKKAIIVTSWYHTRRTYAICKRIFRSDDVSFFLVSAQDDISSPLNWWEYRYEAIRVLEEFPKLILFYLFPCLSFIDDPLPN